MNTQTIALAGKGGVGKTTITGMLIKYLENKHNGPILAVDADANSNLNEVLGLEAPITLGEIREQMERDGQSGMPSSMTKAEYAEMKFGEALAEGDEYDLLVMGRTQGSGCYCFVNGILSNQIAKYASNYRYVVVDNEAGMEHISRGILPKVDTVILVSDCSRRGIQAVARIRDLVNELKIGAKEVKLLVNRAPGGIANEGVMEEIQRLGLDLLGVLPQSESIYEYDSQGKPTADLPDDDEFRRTLFEALDKMNF